MNTPHNLKRIIGGALLSGGIAVADLGMAAGTAQAHPGPVPLHPGPAPHRRQRLGPTEALVPR